MFESAHFVAAFSLYALACAACASSAPLVQRAAPPAVGALQASAAAWISLEDWTPAEGLFAVGTLSNGRGEVTIDDGEVWVTQTQAGASTTHASSAGASPSGQRTTRETTSVEACAQLVHARVSSWVELEVSHDVEWDDLARVLTSLAASVGLDTTQPIPLRIDGGLRRVVWHVGDQPATSTASLEGALVGFLAPTGERVLADKGERLHLHLLWPAEQGDLSGHVDRLTLAEGSIVALPSTRQ